eukprot:TRINITY_DN1055_c0_g1_i2.p1 TRINITY_DN1055_c0_g1~~TRINITY_DN1055_c0_g1_i2.p1  ORF type:complete len:187 (-),score=31.89 TRINITY_DN1055_c0_g1_i2:68-559(-)
MCIRDSSHSMTGAQLGHMAMPMPMYFYWTTETWFLFESWYTSPNDALYFVLGLIGVFLLAFFHQFLNSYRLSIPTRHHKTTTGSYPLLSGESSDGEKQATSFSSAWAILLFAAHCVLSALAMLLLMTFNGWVIIAVTLGQALGFALFGLKAERSRIAPTHLRS